MKNILHAIFLVFFSWSFNIDAGLIANKNSVEATGRIVYQFYHLTDTLTPSFVYNEEMVLYFDKFKSVYTSYRKIMNDSIEKAAFKAAEASGSTHITLGKMNFYTSKEEVFMTRDSKSFEIGNFYRGQEYFIDYPKPDIKWKILDNTMKIAGYQCQKAVGYFKGRTYTAWFTTDIPYSIGPWKLIGLPGAILQATDERNQVKFICGSVIKAGVTPPVNMVVPSNSIKTTEKDFQKMVKAMEDGNAGIGTDNNSVKITESVAGGGQANGRPKKDVLNNPIELSVQ